MAAWQAQAGATLLMPSGPDGSHLYVILNDPKPFHGYGSQPCVVLVNVTTVRAGVKHDDTCVLSPGCHPFVKDESYVLFRSARIERVSHVNQLVKQGLFKPQAAFAPNLLGFIKAGLRSSPFATPEFRNLPI